MQVLKDLVLKKLVLNRSNIAFQYWQEIEKVRLFVYYKKLFFLRNIFRDCNRSLYYSGRIFDYIRRNFNNNKRKVNFSSPQFFFVITINFFTAVGVNLIILKIFLIITREIKLFVYY